MLRFVEKMQWKTELVANRKESLSDKQNPRNAEKECCEDCYNNEGK